MKEKGANTKWEIRVQMAICMTVYNHYVSHSKAVSTTPPTPEEKQLEDELHTNHSTFSTIFPLLCIHSLLGLFLSRESTSESISIATSHNRTRTGQATSMELCCVEKSPLEWIYHSVRWYNTNPMQSNQVQNLSWNHEQTVVVSYNFSCIAVIIIGI